MVCIYTKPGDHNFVLYLEMPSLKYKFRCKIQPNDNAMQGIMHKNARVIRFKVAKNLFLLKLYISFDN